MNPIALGQVPPTVRFGTLQGFHFVTDAHYLAVPRGVGRDKLSAVLNLMRFALRPQEQAQTYDEGYFYPGPAVRAVTIDMAPRGSQDVARQYGGPALDALIAVTPQSAALPAGAQATAFSLWDQKVAAPSK